MTTILDAATVIKIASLPAKVIRNSVRQELPYLLTARRYANNLVRVTVSRRPAQSVRISDRLPEGFQPSERVPGNFYRLTSDALVIYDETQRSLLPLPGWGALPRNSVLTPLAARTLLEAGQVVEDHLGKKVLFCTGTLPGSTPEAILALARYSSEILNRLTQWIRRRDASAVYFGVWEHQDRGALHIHIAIGPSCPYSGQWFMANFAYTWLKILEDISVKSGVDLFAREGGGTWRHDWSKTRNEAEWVRKSVGSYIAKYTSKAVHNSIGLGLLCPGRWWFISSQVRAWINSARACVPASVGNATSARSLVTYLWSKVEKAVTSRLQLINPWSGAWCGWQAYVPRGEIDAVWADIERRIVDLASAFIPECTAPPVVQLLLSVS